MGYVWCDGYVWDMCGVRYVWDMCGVRYANNLLKNPATKRLSGKINLSFPTGQVRVVRFYQSSFSLCLACPPTSSRSWRALPE